MELSASPFQYATPFSMLFITTKTDNLERCMWVYFVRKLHRPRISDAFLADTVYTSCKSAMLQCSDNTFTQLAIPFISTNVVKH